MLPRVLPGEALRPRTVLVADRDTSTRSAIREGFGRLGFAVIEAESGPEALDHLRTTTPGLVIADVALPGVSGYELCREIKDAYGDKVGFILVSAHRTESFDRVGGLLVGADDYVVKPFETDELLARARRLLGRTNGREAGGARIGALTPREGEVLDLLLDGRTDDEMASTLFISPKTVSTHVQRILGKLGVHNRAQVVALVLGERTGVRWTPGNGRPA